MMNNYSSSKNSPKNHSNDFFNQLKRNFRSGVGTLLFAAIPVATMYAQTNPVPQQVPYTQNFDVLNGTAPALPAGWAGWRLEGTLGTVFTGNATADASYAYGTNNSTAPGIYDMIGKLGFLSTNNQRVSPVLSIKTFEKKDIKISYDINVQRVNSNRGLAIKLQYRIGNTGTFTDVEESLFEYVATGTGVNVGSGVAALSTTRLEVNIPQEAWYKDEVQFRWVTARMVNNIGSGDNTSFSIDNVEVIGNTPPDLPVPFPYLDNFDTSNWMLIGGTQTNKFYVGTPTNADNIQYENSKLFVSNNGTGATYTNSSSSNSYAYKNVTLPTNITTARLSFKWMARGESGLFDYGRFYIVPESQAVPQAGSELPAQIPNVIYQANVTNSSTAYALYNTGTAYTGAFSNVAHQFNDNFVDLSNYAGQTVRLVFYWKNDGSLGNNPPLVVDDFIFDYTPNCIIPENLTAENITYNSAQINWTSSSSNFEYYYSTSDTAPTASTNPSGSSQTTSATLSNLSTLTTYHVWVRNICDDNTRTAWSEKLTFTTNQVPTQYPYTDDFETSQWQFANGTQTNKFYIGTPSAGNNVSYENGKLFVSNDGLTNNYLTTASSVYAFRDITLPDGIGNVSVKFKWIFKGEGTNNYPYDYGRFYILPITSTPVAGVSVGSSAQITNAIYTASNNNVGPLPYLFFNPSGTYNGAFSEIAHTYKDDYVNLSGYGGQTVRMVFAFRNDSGAYPPSLAIDDFAIEPAPTCLSPLNVSSSNITSNSAQISWDNSLSTSANGYEYYYSTEATAPTETTTPSGTTTSNSVNITGLNPTAFYNVWVRTSCGGSLKSEWSEKITFQTNQNPGTFPYTDSFDESQWMFVNGTQTNKFYIGTPQTANNLSHADNKLFVSNNGTTATYGNTTTRVYAYRDISLPSDITLAKVAFKWAARGENGPYDFGRFFITTTDQIFNAGTEIASSTTANVANSIFNGKIDASIRNSETNLHAYYSDHAYEGAFESPYDATTSTGGHHYYEKDGIDLSNYAGQTVRVVFYWQNDGSGGTAPSLVVDDFVLSNASNCLAIENLNVDYSHINARLSWSGNSDTYTYYLSTTEELPSNGTTVSTSNAFVENLTPNTTYYWWVKADCDPTNNVVFGGSFTTIETPLNYPLIDNFDTPQWRIVNGTTGNKFYIGTPTDSEIDFQNNALFISNNGTSNTYTIASAISAVFAYNDILLPEDASNVKVQFNWSAAGESTFDYGRFFIVKPTYNPIAGTVISTTDVLPNQIFGSDKLNLTGNSINLFDQELDLSNYAGQVVRVIFYWRNDNSIGTQPPLAVDNFCFANECSTLSTGNVNVNDFIYYPNPVQNELNFKGDQLISSIEVFNLAGQVVNHSKVTSKSYTLNTSKLSAGVYMVRVAFENGTSKTVKIIKK